MNDVIVYFCYYVRYVLMWYDVIVCLSGSHPYLDLKPPVTETQRNYTRSISRHFHCPTIYSLV